MTCDKVVIVSDSPEMCTSLEALVAQLGVDTETNNSLERWLQAPKPTGPRCVVLDTAVGDLEGVDRLVKFAAACASQRVLVLTNAGDVQTAVQVIRQGAADVLQKPAKDLVILERIRRVVEAAQ